MSLKTPFRIDEGANRRRKLVLWPFDYNQQQILLGGHTDLQIYSEWVATLDGHVNAQIQR
jgi:hypothetical protein